MIRDRVAGRRAARDNRWLAVIPVSLVFAVISLLLFAWLAEQMLAQGIQRFDDTIRASVHQHAFPLLTHSMWAITYLGDWQVILAGSLLLLIFFWYRRAGDYLRLLLVTLTGAGVLDGVLKLIFQRPRPDPFFASKPDTYSFPSGHSLVSLCFYGLLAGMISLHAQKAWQKVAAWTAALLLIGSIGFSRIYLGVHWPSDVLAGYAAAIVWMGAVRLMAKKQEERHAPQASGPEAG
jgi:undecaprenyl-diphosphatase